MNSRCAQRAFTLIELLLVIVVLTVVAVGTSQFVQFGAQIYTQGNDRAEAVAQGRFLLLRLEKELRNSAPNSLRVNGDGSCLEYTPFKASGSYVNTLPSSPPYDVAVIKLLDGGAFARVQGGDRVTIYPQTSADIYHPATQHSHPLASAPSNNNKLNTWRFNAAFTAESPAKRLFVLDQPVTFCLEGTALYRYSEYGVNQDMASATALQSVGAQRSLLAQDLVNVTQGQRLFTLEALALSRNALVNMRPQMGFNGSETLLFNHEVQLPNVP